MDLLLLNETGVVPHIGCLAVANANARMLSGAGHRVKFRTFVTEYRELWNGDEASSITAAEKEFRDRFDEVNGVVVNGEGTLHHGAGLHLLAVAGAAQRRGLKTFLVNTVFQEIDAFRDVLRRFDDFVVRDACSLKEARAFGCRSARMELDSVLAADWGHEPMIDLSGKVVVSDWFPGRTRDVGVAMRAFERSRPNAFFFPFRHGIHLSCWRSAVATLKTARSFVCARHHGLYVAGLAAVPFVAFPSNSHKVEGLIEASGLPIPFVEQAADLESALRKAENEPTLFEEFGEFLRGRSPLTTFQALGNSTDPATAPTERDRQSGADALQKKELLPYEEWRRNPMAWGLDSPERHLLMTEETTLPGGV
jgi:hypothetical protein